MVRHDRKSEETNGRKGRSRCLNHSLMKSGLLKLMELNVSSRTSLIESKIIVNAAFLGSRVCEGKVSASTHHEPRDAVTASYLVGQHIQSFIQNIRGFGEEKLPDRS